MVTVVTIATFKMKPVYEAAARVEVDKESHVNMQFVYDQNSYDDYLDTDAYIETQTKILDSETLAMDTIRSMDLGKYPEFGGNSAATAFGQGGATFRRPAILGEFLGDLTVKRVPDSRLIEVRFDAENPQLAAEVVNAHLQNYIEQNFKSKYDATTQASNWLSSELEELRIKVEKSEDARLAYERENQIWQVDEKQDITTQKLADLSKAVTEAQTELSGKEALYRMAMSGEVDAIPTVRDSPVISGLEKQKSDLDEQYADASNQYGPNFPKVQRLKDQEAQVDADLAKARNVIMDGIREDYNTALSHVQILQEALDKQKAEANDMAEKLVQYNILEHDAEANKQLYDGLLQKLKEASITAGLRSSNIRIVDPALVPSNPSRPNKARNILLALLVGLIGGVGLALFREYLDNTVKSPDDIESLTGLPSLAVVPTLPGSNGHHSRLARLGREASPQAPWSSRGAAFLRAAEVADFRSVPGAANIAAAVAGRASAAGDPGDERAAARRKDDRRRESGGDSRAVGRPHAVDGFRHAQAWHPPGVEPDEHERGRTEFVPGGGLHARRSNDSTSGDQQPVGAYDRAGAAEPGRPALFAPDARGYRGIAPTV